MPTYVYECSECEKQFKASHLMTENYESCDLCESTNIQRVPTMFTNLSKKITKKSKVGDETKDFIEQSKEELKQQKKDLDNER
tara:strand:- start:697 stop:945 length:249 start_codon:yes stop_codon:yes gene_type:complete